MNNYKSLLLTTLVALVAPLSVSGLSIEAQIQKKYAKPDGAPIKFESQKIRLDAFLGGSYGSNINHDDGIDYDSFVEKIKLNKTATLEGALELVPKTFFDNYVLMYRSRSLQNSNYLFPRAIVFGRSARFIMAFNGHKKHRGYNNLEIIQYRDKTQRWEFREITFLPGQPAKFSKPNPKKCLECHQSPKRNDVDPRPNWEPYNFWPGSYASVDDTLKPELQKGLDRYKDGGALYPSVLKKFKKEDFILVDEQAREELLLADFEKKIKPKHARYRFLGKFQTRDPLNFTKSLVGLNFFRVVRLAKESLNKVDPNLWATYKYAFAGLQYAPSHSSRNLGYQCTQLYLPDSVRQKHYDALKSHRNYAKILEQKPGKGYGFRYRIDLGIEAIFEPLGIQTEDWSMDFKTDGRFSFDNRFTSPNDSAAHLRDAIRLLEPELAKIKCEDLKKVSHEKTQAFNNSGTLDQLIERASKIPQYQSKPLVQRCINCHVDFEEVDAPYIPFDDPQQLKPLLAEIKYVRGSLAEEIIYRVGSHASIRERMPPSGAVSQERVKEFIDWIKGL